MGTDFSSFWTATKLALSGNPAAAWLPMAHAAAEHHYFPASAGYHEDYYAFFYPPPFLLLLLPLGFLSYGAATGLWVTATSGVYLASLRALLPRRWPALLPGLAFPALLINAEHGQNGALCATLLAGGACQLDRRPRLARACLGLLCVKPQLALLVVPSLLAARRWRSLAWFALSVGVLCLASLLVFGDKCWQAFLGNTSLARSVLEDGLVSYAKMASSFAAARLLDANLPTAWFVQALSSAAAVVAVVAVARRRPGAAAEIATVATASCLATPFLLDYDLMIAVVPLAWLARAAAGDPFRGWETAILVAAFALPLIARPLAMQLGLPVTPLVLAVLLGLVVRRTRLAPAGLPGTPCGV